MPYAGHEQKAQEKDLYKTFQDDPLAQVLFSGHHVLAIDVVDCAMYFAFPPQPPGKESGAECISRYLIEKFKGNSPNLKKAADLILKEFINPLKNKGGRSPGTMIDPDDTMQRDNIFRDKLLRRDKRCCVVTGLPDRSNNDLSHSDNCHYRLEGAHIFPSALRSQSQSTSQMIKRFCADRGDCYLFGEHVDNTNNGLLLQHDAHGDFDDYLWSLERVGTDPNKHSYKVEIMVETVHGLSFEVTDGKDVDLKRGLRNDRPAPQLLQLHLQFSRLLKCLRGKYIVQQPNTA